MAALAPVPKLQFFDANGNPLVGGKLYSYTAGTTTPLATYTDYGGGTPNANPVVLDSRGEAAVWLSPSATYKLKLTTSTGTEIWTVDNIGGPDQATLATLLNTASASKGAGAVGFGGTLAYASGTVGAAIQLAYAINVRHYGATGDGSTDDTTAMAAAHATGRLVYYPAGTYKFSRLSSGITSGGIVGDGQTQTKLLSTSTDSNDLFTFTGNSTGGMGNQLTFRDFQIQGALSGPNPAKSAGAAIAISPASSSENSYASFFNVTIAYVPIGIHFVRASLWHVTDCNLLGYNIAGLKVENRNDHDSGDSNVTGCIFNCPYTTGAGILHKSSGGLRVLGNKFLGGAYGYQLDYDSAAGDTGSGATGIVLVSDNSIENQTTAGILLGRATGSAAFTNMQIVGNEFAGATYGIATDSNTFLTDMTISGNVFQMVGTGSPRAIAMVGVQNLMISGNTFRGNGGSPLAMSLTSCSYTKVGINSYYNTGDPVTFTTPGTNCSIVLDSQSGSSTTSTSGWSAYGTLYQSPTTTVTFAQPFLKTPQSTDVTLIPGSGTGAVGAIVVSVSTTQLSYVAIASTTNPAAVMYWKVNGIL